MSTAKIEAKPDADTKAHAGGYRLWRLEILNWGTFNGRIHEFKFNGEPSCIVGPNGGGKSTVLDAMLTLLVRKEQRTYNVAALGVSADRGSSRKSERDERSYIQGMYGRNTSDEGIVQPLVLRKEKDGQLSCILGVFHDFSTNESYTLIHALWLSEGEVKRVLGVCAGDHSMKSIGVSGKSPKELRKHLDSTNWNLYESFKEYEAKVRRVMRVQSESAFRLLNQTVAVKDVGQITVFVRQHMLPRPERLPYEQIEAVKVQFKDLIQLHDGIQRLQEQIDEMKPLVELAKTYRELNANVERMVVLQTAATSYYHEEHLQLLDKQRETQAMEAKKQEEVQAGIEGEQAAKREELLKIEIALANDTVEQRKKDLQRAIKEAGERHTTKSTARNEFIKYLSAVSPGKQVTNEAEFDQAKVAAAATAERRNQLASEAIHEQAKLNAEKVGLDREREELRVEIELLRKNASKIDPKHAGIRSRVAVGTGIAEADLPFVGELLELMQGEEDWRGAVELILRGFSLSMLVAERHYKDVRSFFQKNANELGLRITYHQVLSSQMDGQVATIGRGQLPGKLAIKTDSPFRGWLSRELVRGYDFKCVDALADLEAATMTLLRTGHARHGGQMHRVGSNYDINDPHKHYIGWDNAKKRDAIIAKAIAAEKRASQWKLDVAAAEKTRGEHEAVRNKAAAIAGFKQFGDIDAETEARTRKDSEEELAKLEKVEDKNTALRQSRTTLTEAIADLEGKKTTAIGAAATAREQRDAAITTAEMLARRRSAVWPEGARDMIDEVRRYQPTKEALSLRNIETISEKVIQRIQGARNNLMGDRDESKSNIERLMAGYLAKPGRETLKHELAPQITYLEQFERHMVELDSDGMPPLKARYRELMRGRLQIGVSQMRLEIDKAERDIEKRIQDLNGTLRFIDFTADTYIQLRHRSSSDQDVHAFNAMMKECMHGMQSPAEQVTDDDREKVFNALRKMFAWADENPDRFNKAGDPRNAKHFHAEELYRENNQRKFRHDDSQGKSGGEKAKLAYTILASAIAFQYNLKPGHTSDGFRLVLVDEIFSKLSETNAGFTMDLFRKFDLQLVMVMPMDSGLQLVQSFAKTFHVVSSRENKETGHVTSHTYSISSENFKSNADLEKEANAAR